MNNSRAKKLWTITCYFNPAGYTTRLENYHIFRRYLKVPLVTVELSFNGGFELTPDNADILVQINRGDIMWQKERLLNVALDSLPGDCELVAWIDCDVVFERQDWPELTAAALEKHSIVHPFKYAYWLSKEERLEDAKQAEPHVSSVLSDLPKVPNSKILEEFGHLKKLKRTGGFAWAARREVLADGFYDACVIGSGNRAILCAQFGCFDAATKWMEMNEIRTEHYMNWAEKHFKAVKGNVGFIDGRIFHLWHGDLTMRGYGDRHKIFSQYNFDPFKDVALNDDGSWVWNSSKTQMHQFLEDYFFSRQEDGIHRVMNA